MTMSSDTYQQAPSAAPQANDRVSLGGRDYHLRRLLAVADCTAVVIGATVATGLTGAVAADVNRVAWSLVTLPGWILLFKIYGLYDRDGKRVSHSTVDDIPWLFHALLIGTIGLWLSYKVVPVRAPSLWQALVFFAATFAGVLATRAGARALAGAVTPAERVLFVGCGPSAGMLERKMRAHPEYRLEPVGFVASRRDAPSARLSMPHLGPVDNLEALCIELRVDRVLLVSSTVDEQTLLDTIRRLNRLDVRISVLPQVFDALGPSVEVDDVEGVTVLGLNPVVLTRSSRFLKRCVDLLVAVPVTAIAAPVMMLIAIAVKLDSRGPILYRQERIGRGGRQFWIYKFRTMVIDADARAEELRQQSRHDVWLLLDHDPRITRVGRFLRPTSLDELPQLFNVIAGTMSLVGPRPMPPDVDRRISGWGRRRLDLTPGVTGLWQVLGRTNIPFEEMVKLDYVYVTNWSLWNDIRLLIRTFPVVLNRRGAN
jgi:exopolysaccharide biosynthesis polyprenyl glycosylphosphotransferase